MNDNQINKDMEDHNPETIESLKYIFYIGRHDGETQAEHKNRTFQAKRIKTKLKKYRIDLDEL